MNYPIAERRFREARTRLTFARPYFAHGAYALRLIVTTDVPSFAVDGWWRCYGNPHWIERHDVAQTATALSHELQHLLFDHAGRAVAAGVSFSTMHVWNAEAADPDINDGLMVDCRNCKPPLPELPAEWCSLPKHFDLPDHRAAEWYYAQRMLVHREERRTGGGEAQESGGAGNGGAGRSGRGSGQGGSGRSVGQADFGCGSGSSGVPAPWEVGSPEGSGIEGIESADAWDLRRRIAGAIKTHVEGRGSVPDGLVEWANELLRPKRISWDQMLMSAMRRASHTVAGLVRHDYSRPSRRQHAFGQVIMPSFRRPVPNVVFVSDTSLSMDSDQRALVRGVVDSACRQLAVPLRILDVDAAVHRDVMVSSGRQVSHVGRGGTDMCVGIEQAMRRPRPADCIVVCTDCDTPWPLVKPRAHMIVVAVNASREAIAGIPSWATVIEAEAA